MTSVTGMKMGSKQLDGATVEPYPQAWMLKKGKT